MRIGRRDTTAASAEPRKFYGWKTLIVVAVMYFAMTVRISDVSRSYMSEWKLSILILTSSLVSLILARPPVHPSISRIQANSISG
jgi:antibiotic biosynthesis monooxygenase (ABM) superfamily enzyme